MTILTRLQFAQSNFSREGYTLNEQEGVFTGTLKFAVWGEKRNAIGYVELDNGRKIICSGFQNDEYLGINLIPFETRVELTYEKGKRGNVRLKAVRIM